MYGSYFNTERANILSSSKFSFHYYYYSYYTNTSTRVVARV